MIFLPSLNTEDEQRFQSLDNNEAHWEYLVSRLIDRCGYILFGVMVLKISRSQHH